VMNQVFDMLATRRQGGDLFRASGSKPDPAAVADR
jgi:hypothetical protein